MKLKPLSNRVLIELLKEEAKITQSGIVLPDTVDKKEQTKGTVIAVGPGKLNEHGERIPIGVKVGERVIFNKPWSDDKKMKEGEKEIFLVDEDDILAVIE